MALKIAINGFGRIGRLVMRELLNRNTEVEIIGINDLTDAKTLAHLFKYDSVHGKYKGEVSTDGNNIIVDGKAIPVSASKSIEDIPWKNPNIVIESTGVYTSKDALMKHVEAGAGKVILTAPAKDTLDATVVLGVNSEILTGAEKVLSNASCTTNCLAPMVKVLDDNFGIEVGFMTTIHAYTNDQRILDLPHKDLRRARAGAVNAIPTSTGAAKAVGLVMPELAGKLKGYAVRIPVPDGSLTDFTCIVKKTVTKEDVNNAMKLAANGAMKGILEYSEDPLVSSDIIGNSHSCIFDSDLTDVNGTMVKVVGWYDNEYGYSCRIADLALMIANM